MKGREIGWLAVLAFLPLAAAAQKPPSVEVVELFTSQGCSDCPPADALLGELSRFPGVVALAYHVTYWDDLGWHDRFGLPQANARQQYYVQQLHLSSAFTPQAVIDGRTSLIGSDRRAIATALRMSAPNVPVSLALADSRIQLELAAQKLPMPLNVILVGYLPQAATAVGSGENHGHELEEFNIVRAYQVLGIWRGHAQRFLVPLSSLPPEVSHIAVLLQQPTGMISGAGTLTVR